LGVCGFEASRGMISGQVKPSTLDMTSKKSDECRKTSVDVVKEEPPRIRRLFHDLKPYGENSLIPWLEEDGSTGSLPAYKVVPH